MENCLVSVPTHPRLWHCAKSSDCETLRAAHGVHQDEEVHRVAGISFPQMEPEDRVLLNHMPLLSTSWLTALLPAGRRR